MGHVREGLDRLELLLLLQLIVLLLRTLVKKSLG